MTVTLDSDSMPGFGPQPWFGESLAPDAGQYALPSAVLEELIDAANAALAGGADLTALEPSSFELGATGAFADALRAELQSGCGFALVDRLPVDILGIDRARIACWLLSSCVGRPVEQSHDGKLAYDVMDLGRPPGNGVRPDVTSVGQNFHTDNSYNLCAPETVVLLCLHVAARGGESGVVSFGWAWNAMRERHPDLLARLHEPYWFDRQREHAPGDAMTIRHPLFETVGNRLVARLSHRQVVNGHQMAGEPLTGVARDALEALEALLETPGAARTFTFEPGQMQFVNNHALGHRRTAFVDAPPPAPKRRLLRLWLRDSGPRQYMGGVGPSKDDATA